MVLEFCAAVGPPCHQDCWHILLVHWLIMEPVIQLVRDAC